jgi:hypothetical protein
VAQPNRGIAASDPTTDHVVGDLLSHRFDSVAVVDGDQQFQYVALEQGAQR